MLSKVLLIVSLLENKSKVNGSTVAREIFNNQKDYSGQPKIAGLDCTLIRREISEKLLAIRKIDI